MNRLATRVASLGAVVSLVAVLASPASAVLRVPQVLVTGGGLQAYLSSQGETINVLTDQDATQSWASTVSNNSTFTIQVELSAFAAANDIGLYNASAGVPPLYQVFPGAASAGWWALASFRTLPTRVVVNLFDANSVSQGQTTYLGADRNNFGFYLNGPGGLFYTQDGRNPGGLPQALTFAGTNVNVGSWWLAFEDKPFGPGAADLDAAVLFLESVNPTPVHTTSWGELKARFR
jgi:hypothetical protein